MSWKLGCRDGCGALTPLRSQCLPYPARPSVPRMQCQIMVEVCASACVRSESELPIRGIAANDGIWPDPD